MNIAFITTNKHKYEEVKDILQDIPIELEHLDMEYEENHDDGIEAIARTASEKLAQELNRPIVLEDTGLFFEAYNGFPGALPKFIYQSIGFKGIFKLLEGESRNAYFKTVVGYCEPNKKPQLFEGIMKGKITEKVHNENKDTMPYDKIFIPDGKQATISDMTIEEKNTFSQRAKAFKEFKEYLKQTRLS